jgi:hypothetical protein
MNEEEKSVLEVKDEFIFSISQSFVDRNKIKDILYFFQ